MISPVKTMNNYKRERFISLNSDKNSSMKKDVSSVSGISRLTPGEIKKYEGKFVDIVNGKVAFADTNAQRVIKWVLDSKATDKVFSSIPKAGIFLVK